MRRPALVQRRRQSLLEDVAKARRQKAPRSARAGLKEATAAESRRDTQAFYEALWRSFSDYFGNRLNLPPGDVTAPDVLGRLRRGGLDESVLDDLRNLCEACDHARFAGVSEADPDSFQDQRRRLAGVLKACERVKL